MAQQVIFNTPSNDMAVIDNGAAQVVITANGAPQVSNGQTGIGFDKATLGLDNKATASSSSSQLVAGTITQGVNSFGDTGNVLLDTVNDIIYADPQVATFAGNPNLFTLPTYAKVSTVMTGQLIGPRLLFKNPA